MSDRGRAGRHGPIRASLVSAACLLRGLPLFFSAAPRTPLRVLGIIAFDTLHVLRHSRPLARTRIKELATFLDFQGCANATWDRKAVCQDEYEAIRRELEKAGMGPCIDAYLSRLRELESRRPSVGRDRRHFEDVRAYREGVARLSITTAAAIALHECPEEEIRATQYDSDVDTLFRILMQCQVIDDVLDYHDDVAVGLPSFLTATASLADAMELTANAARSYADGPLGAPGSGVFPLRMALRVVTSVATLVVRAADPRHRSTPFPSIAK